MTAKVWAFFLGFVLVAGLVGAWISPEANKGFVDGTSAITFITLVAVGIERMIEICWTLLGQAKSFGGWWPLSQIATSVATVEKETNDLLGPACEKVRESLEGAKATLKKGDPFFTQLEKELQNIQGVRETLQARLDAAKDLAPGSARIAMTSDVAADAARVLGDAAKAAGTSADAAVLAVNKAAQGAAIATTIVSSFGDNPARRMASILLGAGIGMLVAGFVGLNLFAAVLGADAGVGKGVIGVLVTGIVIGLGSSPTHEVIKSLQDYKESRKPGRLATVPGTAVTSESAVADMAGGQQWRLLAAVQDRRETARPQSRVREGASVLIRSTG